MRDYRKEVEEDIIYNYMMHQQHKSQSIVSPVRIEQYYKENKDRFYQDDSVHLRLIQLSRAVAADGRRTQGPGRRDPAAPALGREVRGPGQGVQLRFAPRQGRRLGMDEAVRPQARVQRAAFCRQEGRMLGAR